MIVLAGDGPVVEIDKIIITESVSTTKEVPVTAQPSGSISIKSTAPKLESASDRVQQISGVHIQRYGGLDEATSISIRGSSGSQVKVLLDGVPLETASAEGIGLGHVATATLSKIEVYKSLTPSEFGVGCIGGVVNLKSREFEKGLSQRYGLGFGSFLTFDTLGELMYGGKKNDVSFGINYRRTDGDFSYLDNNGTPLNLADDQRVNRQNNEKQTIHPYLKWHHRFHDRLEMKVTQHFFRIDSGVPGLANFQSLTADKSLTEWLGSFQFDAKGFFKDRVKVSNNIFYRLIKSQFSDPNAEIGLGIAQDNDNITWIVGDRFLWQTDLSKNIIVKEGAEYTYEWFKPKDYVAANPVGSVSSRHQINVFLEPHFYFFKKKFLFSLKGQSINAFYDINNNDNSLNNAGTFTSGKTENQFAGSAAINFEPVKNLHFKASAGREVRLPQFVEMFGDQGFVLGNAQLTSEKTLKFDAGIVWLKKYKDKAVGKIHFETNYFEAHTDDLIQFEMVSGYARASNIGSALIRGFEVGISTELFKYISLSSNYTFQWAKDSAVNVGNFLVGRPKHEINAGVDFEKGIFSTGMDVNFIDDQYLDGLNTQRVDNRLVLNFDTGVLIKERYRLGFEIKNITNSQVVDAVGFPLPGRSFFGRVDVMF